MINYSSQLTNTRGQINAILSIEETASVYGYEDEPVTVDEVKTYCNIDSYWSGDDELLQSLITASREILEKYLGISLIPHRIMCILQNDCGGIELPYGPIQGDIDTTLITDIEGNEVELNIYGGAYKYIQTEIGWVQLIYDTGFDTLPGALKTAIKAQTFFLYQNRGEKNGQGSENEAGRYNPDYVCNAAKQLSVKYRRVWDMMI